MGKLLEKVSAPFVKIVNRLIIIFCISLFYAACSNDKVIDSESIILPYIDNYYKAPDQEKSKQLVALDSVYYLYKNPSVFVQLRRFSAHSDYSFEKNEDAKTAVLYLDSLLALAKPEIKDKKIALEYVKV